jgi:hypothetical protein
LGLDLGCFVKLELGIGMRWETGQALVHEKKKYTRGILTTKTGVIANVTISRGKKEKGESWSVCASANSRMTLQFDLRMLRGVEMRFLGHLGRKFVRFSQETKRQLNFSKNPSHAKLLTKFQENVKVECRSRNGEPGSQKGTKKREKAKPRSS